MQPQIYYDALPEAEKEHAILMSRHLRDLQKCVDRFEGALALFDFSVSQIADAEAALEAVPRQSFDEVFASRQGIQAHETYRAALKSPLVWLQIAADDGAMTIWAFHKTLVAINKGKDRCLTISNIIDRKFIDGVLNRLSAYFPDHAYARNAFGHSAELAQTVGRLKDNAYDGALDAHGIKIGAGSKNNMISGIDYRQVFTTIYKKVVQYEMSQASLDKLNDLCQTVYTAFEKAEKETIKMARDRFKLDCQKNLSGDQNQVEVAPSTTAVPCS